MIYYLAWYIFFILSKLFFPLKISGLESIPRQGSFIFASNHRSYLDPMLVGLCYRRKLSYVAKDTLFKNKFFGFLLNQVGAFPVRRNAPDIRSIKEALKRLKRGCPIVIFPEGTRVSTGEGKKPELGAGFLAVKADVPVVPVFIEGSDRVLPPGSPRLKPGPIYVTIGKPMRFLQPHDYPRIAAEIMDAVSSLRSNNK